MREYDEREIQELNAEPWMIDILKLNVGYNHWGCFEDYMNKEDAGWETRSILQSFDEMWKLDDYNELVNFYFGINRESIECIHCGGTGYNKETYQLSKDYYDF